MNSTFDSAPPPWPRHSIATRVLCYCCPCFRLFRLYSNVTQRRTNQNGHTVGMALSSQQTNGLM